jgi:hypothetical protein
MSFSFAPDSAFKVNEPKVISETIEGETIIINLESGTYYSLKNSGAAIWAAIQQSASLGAIAAMVRSSYAVDGDDVEHDIATLVQRLVEEDLVRPTPGNTAPPTACGPASEGRLAPFVAPVLDKFTDMEAMLLLDPVHDVDEKGWPNLPKERRMDG